MISAGSRQSKQIKEQENIKMQKNNVEKDACKFYGISKEQYDIIVGGIGITDSLKKYGIEITKQS